MLWVQEGGLLRAAHHDVPCDLMKQSWGGSGRAEHLLSTFMDLGSLLVNTKRRRDTQQQGTIDFRDFQLNSLFKKSETIRRCEDTTEHVSPSPGRGPWCPSMGMSKYHQHLYSSEYRHSCHAHYSKNQAQMTVLGH